MSKMPLGENHFTESHSEGAIGQPRARTARAVGSGPLFPPLPPRVFKPGCREQGGLCPGCEGEGDCHPASGAQAWVGRAWHLQSLPATNPLAAGTAPAVTFCSHATPVPLRSLLWCSPSVAPSLGSQSCSMQPSGSSATDLEAPDLGFGLACQLEQGFNLSEAQGPHPRNRMTAPPSSSQCCHVS